MPTVPTEIPPQARRGLRKIGLDEALEDLVMASDSLVESEQAFREQGRLRAGRAAEARIAAAKKREDRLNDEGRRQLRGAASQFDRAKQLDREVRQEIDQAIETDDFRARLAEARETLVDGLVDGDITGDETEELLQIWDDAVGALERDGFDGLMNRAQEKVREARELRGQDNRGRQAASPLAAWKYAVIAGTLVIGVASVIACFIWGACVWVAALLKYYGWYGGILLAMIANGCAPIPESP